MATRRLQTVCPSNNLCFLSLMLICNTATFFVAITFYSPCPYNEPSEVEGFESSEYRLELPPEYLAFTSAQSLPFGFSSNSDSDTMYSPVGAVCTSFPEELRDYMSYYVNESCPDDELLAKKLLLKGCEPLPRRRCRPVAQAEYTEPKPFPDCLWSMPADTSVVWTAYRCKNYDCLVNRYISISQRLPFFDNTLDIVHSMHVLSNWIPTTLLHFLLFDVYRVLRPGGLFWMDHFFCFGDQLEEVYAPLIESIGFVKLKWVTGMKVDKAPELREMYLSALLEKPLNKSW